MKVKFYTLTLFAISILVISCKTASKLYQQGNYDDAVELAAKKLQKNPDDPKLLDVIQNAYRFAVNDHETRVRNLSESNNELKWEWMYNEYLSLQKLYDAIYRVPAVYAVIAPINYSSSLITSSEKAGDVRFNRGIALMNNFDKTSYQNAYREFQIALRYIPGDINILTKMDEAFENAVTNVIVLPIQQNGGFVYSSYGVGKENFDDKLIQNLQYNSGNEFVKFYSAWDARRLQIRTDKLMEIKLSSLNPGRVYDIKKSRNVSKEVVVKEIVYKPDSVVKQYAKVNAELITVKRIIEANAVLQLTISDENGRWLWNENIPAAYSWNTEYTTYKGDERALSAADKEQIDHRQAFPPTENDIVSSLLDDINQKAAYQIRNYFNRY